MDYEIAKKASRRKVSELEIQKFYLQQSLIKSDDLTDDEKKEIEESINNIDKKHKQLNDEYAKLVEAEIKEGENKSGKCKGR